MLAFFKITFMAILLIYSDHCCFCFLFLLLTEVKSLFDLCTQVLIDNIDGKTFSQIGLYYSPFIPFFFYTSDMA